VRQLNRIARLGSIFFISDAHLGLARPEEETRREKALLDFFEWISDKAEALVVVGDLFDFWFEYASVIPREYFDVLCGLKKLRGKGISIDYIVGNHDCWLETFFPDVLGIPVHAEPLIRTLQGKKVYIGHGDGMAKKDVGYRILKKIIRNRISVRLYKTLHPTAAFKIALFFSGLSRNHRPVRNRDEEYAACARTLFREGYDCVVLGHTHRPYELRENGRTYVNTGDWMEHFTFGRLENGRLSLEPWPLQDREPESGSKEHS
jgi:UDP-2,3-diacylglucosamine hydrolase